MDHATDIRDQDMTSVSEAAAKPNLVLRLATTADVAGIAALSKRVYGSNDAFTQRQIRGQINNFAEGQFVAEYDGEVVGHAATFIISGKLALAQHTWTEITGNGYASRHNADGDYLYGMEVSVDPRFRRLRIGKRLYRARKNLCEDLGLKGIIFGGRMPGYARRKRKFPDPMDYIAAVRERTVKDTAIGFHIAQDFEAIGYLENYDPTDRQSDGHATHMVWRNPRFDEAAASAAVSKNLSPQEVVRVATVQWQMRGISHQDEFKKQVQYFVDVASDYESDFVVFPELFTNQLLSLEEKPLPPKEGMERVATYTDWFVTFMSQFAVSYNINIIGGSHCTADREGNIRNVAYVFLRDGAVHTQDKIHPTPSESYWWDIRGGSRVEAINTDCGPIGVLVCYDSEFPELSRHLADQGAMILFVPFCTDERRGFLRVRYCCHARAIENQMYVALSGVVGNLPNVENMDIHYAESCILTPCDFAFARDGVAADTGPNTETIAFADLRMSDLRVARAGGSTRNFADRRFDLYRVVWQR